MSPHPAEPPLRPPVFHILLALAERDLHGLGIADAAEEASEGAVELGPGTLYRSLSELADAELIRQVEPPREDADPRRKYYRLTDGGRRVLVAETSRLQRVLERARDGRILPERA